MSKVLCGRVPACGHVVVIDADTSPNSRRRLARKGLDIITEEWCAAVDLFLRDLDPHEECLSRGQIESTPVVVGGAR